MTERVVSPLGLRVDESSPYVDARLPDGSHVDAIVPPLSLCGPAVTIRKFGLHPFTPDDLIQTGSVTEPVMAYLAQRVRDRANVVVSGGTGSGETTLLGVLSSFIPAEERLITIEDVAWPTCACHSPTWSSWRRGRRMSTERARSRCVRWSAMRSGCGQTGSWWERSAPT